MKSDEEGKANFEKGGNSEEYKSLLGVAKGAETYECT
jgi:hypothetical protein